MRTHVRFNNDETFELSEQAATAFVGYSTPTGWSYRAMLGAVVDGSIGTHDFDPGFVAGLGVTHQWPFGDGQWFVTGSAGLSFARASTHMAGGAGDVSFTAGDARIGAIAGRTLGKIWNPYVRAWIWWPCLVDRQWRRGHRNGHATLSARRGPERRDGDRPDDQCRRFGARRTGGVTRCDVAALT
jgi:hypothetical protein